MNLVMKNGAIILVVNLGSGEYEVILKPIDGKFNDNKWHSIRVIRELERVSAFFYYSTFKSFFESKMLNRKKKDFIHLRGLG